MQVTLTLTRRDAEFLERFAEDAGLPSIDEAVHRAIRLLSQETLEAEYAEAWATWPAGPDADLWETTVGDGIDPS